jgi:HEPN domain-containing protein
MRNDESAKNLLREAEYIFQDEVISAMEDQEYNLVVRRAQEVVELAVKAAIKWLGADFPKVHDPTTALIQLVAKKGGKISPDDLERIRTISADLAKERAPAFYWEVRYSHEQARKAQQDAEFVLIKVREMFAVNA